ncbi:MAG: thioesterase [Spirochaetales bacterium]|nr:thioesterase [Spirochaetales bacterium]
MKLFCIPFAGGGASAYAPWKRRLAPLASVVPIQLPGREELWDRPYLDTVAEAALLVADKIHNKADGPYCVFGHSMGGLIAFEALRELSRRGCALPLLLIVSASPAPRLFKARLTVSCLESEGFGRLRELLGPTYDTMAGDKDLFAYVMRTMRADVLMCERYVHESGPALPLPVEAFWASSDPLCVRDEIDAWDAHAGQGLRVHEFEGDHFYFKANPDFEIRLRSALEGAAARA